MLGNSGCRRDKQTAGATCRAGGHPTHGWASHTQPSLSLNSQHTDVNYNPVHGVVRASEVLYRWLPGNTTYQFCGYYAVSLSVCLCACYTTFGHETIDTLSRTCRTYDCNGAVNKMYDLLVENKNNSNYTMDFVTSVLDKLH